MILKGSTESKSNVIIKNIHDHDKYKKLLRISIYFNIVTLLSIVLLLIFY